MNAAEIEDVIYRERRAASILKQTKAAFWLDTYEETKNATKAWCIVNSNAEIVRLQRRHDRLFARRMAISASYAIPAVNGEVVEEGG